MPWKTRFEALVRELSSHPEVTLTEARLGPPTDPAVLAAAQKVAGAAWPKGMTELYTELGSVDIAYTVAGGSGGAIRIPTVTDVWDHASHEDELWFDWLLEENPNHPFARIRPIDRYTNEAYAVLYPVPGNGPARVHDHYCGERLTPTGLSYEEWLELLLRARGCTYWLTLTTGPRSRDTWVEQGFTRMATLFPDFAPDTMSPATPFEDVDTDGE